jgi:predicted DNA-binding protein YlxM (UPF0122 family)
MRPDSVTMTLLLDCYGELLTEKQRTCMDLSCNQDLSLAEIAENEGISRQGVHDSVARAGALLEHYEEKLGCAARALRTRRALELLGRAADGLETRGDPASAAAAAQIRAAADFLKEQDNGI